VPSPDDYGVKQLVQVNYDELDAMGVLYHGRYAGLLDRALMSHWAENGRRLDTHNPQDDTFAMTREYAITFDQPVAAYGPVLVHFWIDRVGRTSAEFGFRILSPQDGTLYAHGRRVVVLLDVDTRLPKPWSDAGRAELEASLVRPVG
jgi:acyl-CoA thioester hydrolase